MKFIGIVRDDLNGLPDRRTKSYDNYHDAYAAAEKLCKRTYQNRGSIDIEVRLVERVKVK